MDTGCANVLNISQLTESYFGFPGIIFIVQLWLLYLGSFFSLVSDSRGKSLLQWQKQNHVFV